MREDARIPQVERYSRHHERKSSIENIHVRAASWLEKGNAHAVFNGVPRARR